MSIHHSFQSAILLSLVEQAVEDSFAPLQTHFGSNAFASDLISVQLAKVVTRMGIDRKALPLT
jgi:hypothetical protein